MDETPSSPPTKVVLPTSFTTVTRLSKALALALFIALPFIGFVVGVRYEQYMSSDTAEAYTSYGQLCSSDTECVCVPSIGSADECGKPGQQPGCVVGVCGWKTDTPLVRTPEIPEPVIPELPSEIEIPNDNATTCTITNCHGLDITCGFAKIPVMCTMMYQVGDGCRQFASCGEVDGSCQPILNKRFTDCKSCVEACEAKAGDSSWIFACESACVNG